MYLMCRHDNHNPNHFMRDTCYNPRIQTNTHIHTNCCSLRPHASVSCSVSSHVSHRFTRIIIIAGSSFFSTLHQDNCLNSFSPLSYVCALSQRDVTMETGYNWWVWNVTIGMHNWQAHVCKEAHTHTRMCSFIIMQDTLSRCRLFCLYRHAGTETACKILPPWSFLNHSSSLQILKFHIYFGKIQQQWVFKELNKE